MSDVDAYYKNDDLNQDSEDSLQSLAQVAQINVDETEASLRIRKGAFLFIG